MVLKLFFFILFLQSTFSFAQTKPSFTKIIRVIESQKINEAQLVYFDQNAADSIGLIVPPGRVGLPQFDTAVINLLGYEIKMNPLYEEILGEKKDENLKIKNGFYIEEDAHGGSGRAGYFEVQKNVWVNVKGIGLTGLGNARWKEIGPPASQFVSHSDGSATLEEAIKEAIYARVSDNELTRGSSRVVAIIYTGRTIEYENGNKVPLALIIRTPIKRFDQEFYYKQMIESIAEANTKRIFKGDLVNRSNIGSCGEMVDFGCMTFTNGFTNIISSQNAQYLSEGESILYGASLSEKEQYKQYYKTQLGKYLFMQLGLPEETLNQFKNEENLFEKIGNEFKILAYTNKNITIDFDAIELKKLNGALNLHVVFRDFIPDLLKDILNKKSKEKTIQNSYTLFLNTAEDKSIAIHHKERIESFIEIFYNLLKKMIITSKEKWTLEKIEKLRKIATFKNRDLPQLVRPEVFKISAQLAREFENDKNADKVQLFIEHLIHDTSFGTGDKIDNTMMITSDSEKTSLYFRAFKNEDGVAKVFNFPELNGVRDQERMGFRITFDQWQSFSDYLSEYVEVEQRAYFKVEIPHGKEKVTESLLSITPFIQKKDQKIWLKNQFNLEGPPLLLNERFGFASSFIRKEGLMSDYRLNPGSKLNYLLPHLANKVESVSSIEILKSFNHPNVFVMQSSLKEIENHWDAFKKELLTSPDFLNKFYKAIQLSSFKVEIISKLYQLSQSETDRSDIHKIIHQLSVEYFIELMSFQKESDILLALQIELLKNLESDFSISEKEKIYKIIDAEKENKSFTKNIKNVLSNQSFLQSKDLEKVLNKLVEISTYQDSILVLLSYKPLVNTELGSRYFKQIVQKRESKLGFFKTLNQYGLWENIKQFDPIAKELVKTGSVSEKKDVLNYYLLLLKSDDSTLKRVEKLLEESHEYDEILVNFYFEKYKTKKEVLQKWTNYLLKNKAENKRRIINILKNYFSAPEDILFSNSVLTEVLSSEDPKLFLYYISSLIGGKEKKKASKCVYPQLNKLLDFQKKFKILNAYDFKNLVSNLSLIIWPKSNYWFNQAFDHIYLSKMNDIEILRFITINDWIEHPRLGEVIEKGFKMKVFHEGSKLAELINNPLIQLLCKQKEEMASCLQKAFDRGFSFKEINQSQNLEFKKTYLKAEFQYNQKYVCKEFYKKEN